MSIVYQEQQLLIEQSIEHSCTEVSQTRIQCLKSTVLWIPAKNDTRKDWKWVHSDGKLGLNKYLIYQTFDVESLLLIGSYFITVVTIVMLWVWILITTMSGACWTWVCCGHCTRWWWEWTLDVPHHFLFRNRDFQWAIYRICIFHGCWFSTVSVVFSVSINQIFKLYSNICTWKTKCASAMEIRKQKKST